jgi:uncharacterized protein with GYD domain
MPTYVVLSTFTEQGIRGIKETVSRSDAAREAAARFGVKMKEIYWTQGQYDLVSIVEGADERSVAAFGLALSQQGNVKFQTLRAFTRDEMADIVRKIP